MTISGFPRPHGETRASTNTVMNLLLRFGFVVFLLLPGGLRADDAPAESAIRAVLTAQAAAWNAGDIDGFMAGYARTPELRFASGGEVTRGWQETLDRYRHRYPDRAAMGTLVFSDLEVSVLAPDAAVVFGRWRLRTAPGSEPSGLFTLVWRRALDGSWRIVADHTSAAAP